MMPRAGTARPCPGSRSCLEDDDQPDGDEQEERASRCPATPRTSRRRSRCPRSTGRGRLDRGQDDRPAPSASTSGRIERSRKSPVRPRTAWRRVASPGRSGCLPTPAATVVLGHAALHLTISSPTCCCAFGPFSTTPATRPRESTAMRSRTDPGALSRPWRSRSTSRPLAPARESSA